MAAGCDGRRQRLSEQSAQRAQAEHPGLAPGRLKRLGEPTRKLAVAEYPTGQFAQVEGVRFSLQLWSGHAQRGARKRGVPRGDDVVVARLRSIQDGAELRDGAARKSEAPLSRGNLQSRCAVKYLISG